MIYFIINIFVFIFGLCIGSFLNCAAYRIEQEKSFLKGRSFCPNCKHNLVWQDLVPILSFLFLKGKCRYCKTKISWQYPIVEVATGILFTLIFYKFGVISNPIGNPETWIPAYAGMTINLFILFYIASSLIIIFIYDLKHYLIPDNILLPAIVILALYRISEVFIYGCEIGFNNLQKYFLATVIAFGFFFIIWLVSAGKWMGFGDVKLSILLGLILGFPNILVGLFLAFFIGSIISIFLMLGNKKSLKSEVPFGPFLITGTFIALLWGQGIINWYTSLILFK